MRRLRRGLSNGNFAREISDRDRDAITLPRSLEESLDKLAGCQALQELIGGRFVEAYIAVKRKEYQTYFRVISSWEREFLLLNV